MKSVTELTTVPTLLYDGLPDSVSTSYLRVHALGVSWAMEPQNEAYFEHNTWTDLSLSSREFLVFAFYRLLCQTTHPNQVYFWYERLAQGVPKLTDCIHCETIVILSMFHILIGYS